MSKQNIEGKLKKIFNLMKELKLEIYYDDTQLNYRKFQVQDIETGVTYTLDQDNDILPPCGWTIDENEFNAEEDDETEEQKHNAGNCIDDSDKLHHDIDPEFKERELQILREKDKSWKYNFNPNYFYDLAFEMRFKSNVSLAIAAYQMLTKCKTFTLIKVITEFEKPLSEHEKNIKDILNRYFKYNGKFIHELSSKELNTNFPELEITCLWLKKS
jgi:hypothetical protein